jgi:hypothetical protein
LLLLLPLWLPAEEQGRKPEGVLELQLLPAQQPVERDSAEFLLTVTSTLASAQLSLTLQPPQEMELLAGELSWQGAIGAGESHTLSFTGRFPVEGLYRIEATAELSGPSSRYRAYTHYLLGEPEQEYQLLSPGYVVEEGGRRLHEVPLPEPQAKPADAQ